VFFERREELAPRFRQIISARAGSRFYTGPIWLLLYSPARGERRGQARTFTTHVIAGRPDAEFRIKFVAQLSPYK